MPKARQHIFSVRLDGDYAERVSVRMDVLGIEDRSEYLRMLIDRDTVAQPLAAGIGVDRGTFSMTADGRTAPGTAVEVIDPEAPPCDHPVEQRKTLAYGVFCMKPGCGVKLA